MNPSLLVTPGSDRLKGVNFYTGLQKATALATRWDRWLQKWLSYHNRTEYRDNTLPQKETEWIYLVSVFESGVVFRRQQAAPQVPWARQQGGHRRLWRREVTDQAAGVHADKTRYTSRKKQGSVML